MSHDKPNDPNDINVSPTPTGVTKYKKTPMLGGFFIFFAIVIFLIFNMAGKQKKRQAQQTSTQDPKQASAKTALNLNHKISNNNWFDNEKYDDIRPKYELKKDNSEGALEEKVLLNESPMLSRGEEKLHQDFSKEKFRTSLEIFRLKERNKVALEKAQLEAMKSPSKIVFNNTNGFNSNNPSNIDSSGFNTQNLNDLNPSASSLRDQLGLQSDPNFQDNKKDFVKENLSSGDYLQSSKQAVFSPYEVKAGTIIPSALITGVNSDLPGSLTAQVRENVYDTVTGNHLLIPQGTRLIGEYDSKISFGQNRALVVWKRLIFPDGDSLNLDKMQGVDVAGYAGFHDKVNHHYMRIYGNALLLSLVGGGYEILNQDSDTDRYEDTLATSIGQQLAQVASEMLRKNMDIQPTIIIRPGYKFNVLVMKDIILEKL